MHTVGNGSDRQRLERGGPKRAQVENNNKEDLFLKSLRQRAICPVKKKKDKRVNGFWKRSKKKDERINLPSQAAASH